MNKKFNFRYKIIIRNQRIIKFPETGTLNFLHFKLFVKEFLNFEFSVF